MKNKTEEMYSQIQKVFEKKIKGQKDLGALFVSFDGEALGVAYSGGKEVIFSALCNFLFDHPEFIELFNGAVDCAVDYHVHNSPPMSSFENTVKGEA